MSDLECNWVFVGRNFRDDGCSQSWETYIGQDDDGCCYVQVRGDETQTLDIGDPVSLIGFFQDQGEETLYDLRNALNGVEGSVDARKILDIQFARLETPLYAVGNSQM
jgi:hypothetical protein